MSPSLSPSPLSLYILSPVFLSTPFLSLPPSGFRAMCPRSRFRWNVFTLHVVLIPGYMLINLLTHLLHSIHNRDYLGSIQSRGFITIYDMLIRLIYILSRSDVLSDFSPYLKVTRFGATCIGEYIRLIARVYAKVIWKVYKNRYLPCELTKPRVRPRRTRVLTLRRHILIK